MDSSDSEDSSSARQPHIALACECEEIHQVNDEDDEEEMSSFTRDPEDACWVRESRLGVIINCANKDLTTVTDSDDDIRTLCHEHLEAINRHLCCWNCLTLVVTGTFLECPFGHRTDPLCNALKKQMEAGQARSCSHCGSNALRERQIQLHLEDSDESQVTEFRKLIVELEQAKQEGVDQPRSVVDQWKERMRALAPEVLIAFRHTPQRVSDLAARMLPFFHLIEAEERDLMVKLVDERGVAPHSRPLPAPSTAAVSFEGALPFEYTDVVIDQDELTGQKAIMFCGCDGVCVPETCACCTGDYRIDKTTGETIVGSIRRQMSAVSECGPACACPTTCGNRLVQTGGKPYPLELFSTGGDRGLGVRAKATIPKGRFIIEYTGAVRTMDYGDVTNNYCFETVLGLERVEIDASRTGSAARCINHSCSPNAVIVKVAWEPVEERRLFHLAIFALEDINEGKEITIDYGDAFWMAKMDEFACLCGSEICRHDEEKRQERLRLADMEAVEDDSESEGDDDEEEEEDYGSDEEDEEVIEEPAGEERVMMEEEEDRVVEEYAEDEGVEEEDVEVEEFNDDEGVEKINEYDDDDEDDGRSDEEDEEVLEEGEDRGGSGLMEEEEDGVVEEGYVKDEGVKEDNEDVEVEEFNDDEGVKECDEEEEIDVVEVSERDEEESEINVIDV